MIIVETEGILFVRPEIRKKNMSLGILKDPDPFIIDLSWEK